MGFNPTKMGLGKGLGKYVDQHEIPKGTKYFELTETAVGHGIDQEDLGAPPSTAATFEGGSTDRVEKEPPASGGSYKDKEAAAQSGAKSFDPEALERVRKGG